MDAETQSTGAPGARHHLKLKLASVSRWIHIYLSMASFAILAFFAITGLTLNHADAFSSKRSKTVSIKGKVDLEWVKPGKTEVARLELVEFLRKTHGVQAVLSDFRSEDTQCALSFRGPGYSADVFVSRDDGSYELNETRLGWIAVINDLHKGRDTGRVWSWVIDASAVLMTVVSLSGLALLAFIKRRRLSGAIACLIGGLVCWVIYLFWVP